MGGAALLNPRTRSTVEVLVVGQCKLRTSGKDPLTARKVLDEHEKVQHAIDGTAELAKRFAGVEGRWILVVHTTTRAAVEAADLPANVVVIDADAMAAHLGPVLAPVLRLVIRGRRANANISSKAELMMVDGVGEATASAILQARASSDSSSPGTKLPTRGGFASWADLCSRVPTARTLAEGCLEF